MNNTLQKKCINCGEKIDRQLADACDSNLPFCSNNCKEEYEYEIQAMLDDDI